ncbi:MAG: hypothetical protein AAGC86_18650, partial [Pseudomonadota bacterium]
MTLSPLQNESSLVPEYHVQGGHTKKSINQMLTDRSQFAKACALSHSLNGKTRRFGRKKAKGPLSQPLPNSKLGRCGRDHSKPLKLVSMSLSTTEPESVSLMAL